MSLYLLLPEVSFHVWHGGAVDSAVASQPDGPAFESRPWSLHVVLASVWVGSWSGVGTPGPGEPRRVLVFVFALSH